ncbi:hypothetical protein EH222_11760 [candidate division KSB1 bacterium]|nr:MAG: hypothetical protein EH222_11760 [candidate division KSB1 bacterium]
MTLMKTMKRFFVKTLTLALLLAAAVRAQNSAALSASNLEPSKAAAYKFEVDFDSQVTQSSRFEIVFPSAFNVSQAMMAVSEKLDGNLTVTVDSTIVTLRRSGGRNAIAANETIDFTIASIINPAQPDQEWEFSFILTTGQTAVEKKVSTKMTLF